MQLHGMFALCSMCLGCVCSHLLVCWVTCLQCLCKVLVFLAFVVCFGFSDVVVCCELSVVCGVQKFISAVCLCLSSDVCGCVV